MAVPPRRGCLSVRGTASERLGGAVRDRRGKAVGARLDPAATARDVLQGRVPARRASCSELLRVIELDRGSGRRSAWAERDRAIVLTAVLTGLRADELARR
jgi:integrase